MTLPTIQIKDATKEEYVKIAENYAQWCKDIYGEDISKDKQIEDMKTLDEMKAYGKHAQERFAAFAKAAMLDFWQSQVIAEKIRKSYKAAEKARATKAKGVPLHG